MLKFLAKLTIFFLILIAAIGVYVYLTPLDLYTYRSWEAMSPLFLGLGQPFYPNQHLEIVEVGELGVRTEYSIEKPVEFITDYYGQRYAGPMLEGYDIIIVGDSNVVGSGLTQADTIAAVLADETGRSVYPFYNSIDGFLNEAHLTAQKPQLVILMRIERRVDPDLCPDSLPAQWPYPTTVSPPENNFQIQILIDRILREGYYSTQYFRSQRSERQVIVNESTGMLFFETSLASPVNSPEIKQETIEAVTRCKQWFEAQGVRFIFIPIPDKENVYFDLIPDSDRPELDVPRDQYLIDVMTGLAVNQVEVIDLLTAYQSARQQRNTPYQLDDTHWSSTGIRIAVGLIMAEINCENTNCNLTE